MELTWWPVAAVGSICFIVTVVLAALLPMTAARRRLRPLANVARLTRLPEYARVARLRSLSTVVTLLVLTVMFGAATWAAARPVRAGAGIDAAHPEDIMLCVDQPVTDPRTAALLQYFARLASTTDHGQRIGLTSANRRLVPLTRDLQYAAARFSEYARDRPASFAPAVPYTDYTSTVEDTLALCISGFPDFEERSAHRRSLIYLGPAERRDAADRRATLFTDPRGADLAVRAGVQINVVDTAPSPAGGWLGALAGRTGGRYAAPGVADLDKALNEIRADTPPARRPDGTVIAAASADMAATPLAIALVSAAVLSVALMVLRR